MSLNIIINNRNAERINKVIAEAEGRATARTIEASDIIDAVARIERHLGIAKKSMVGIKADVDIHAQTFPHAYKYTPESTQFLAVRTTSGWKLTDVYRTITRTSGHTYQLDLPMPTQIAIIKSMEDF